MANRIVLHYADGRIIKGNGYDFSPEKPNFHLMPLNAQGLDKVVDVKLKQLKAVFFVRTFEGNPDHRERKVFHPEEKPYGNRVSIKFKDGEVMVGSTAGYDLDRLGFFFFPADPDCNNIRVFVISAAVESITELEKPSPLAADAE
ncbi:MAG: hypothetical protein BWY87_00477 [Deltaproteobacteria bacterium ADurb.Bin510]|nr:MAG: hypothetical protein BWY87_00477 [Deltaproteobacteria bacterium ADurb.Bin510]